MNNNQNLILLSDSYKYSHARQYPPDSEYVYSYFESRGGAWSKTIFFGLQYILKKYLEGQVITQKKIDEAENQLSETNSELESAENHERLIMGGFCEAAFHIAVASL